MRAEGPRSGREVRRLRHLEIEHQQGHGDREDAIAERLEASGFLLVAPGARPRRRLLVPVGHRGPALRSPLSTRRGGARQILNLATAPRVTVPVLTPRSSLKALKW